MSLVKWNPEFGMSSWMDNFFADNDLLFRPSVKGIALPAVNVKEGKNDFKLEVAIPGFKKDDFNVEVEGDFMTISGETKSEKEDKDEKITRREFNYNSFSRSFSLPKNIKTDEIAAKYDHGILRITLPKAKEKETEKSVKQVAVD